MNAPVDGWIAIWNNVAKKWSNGVNTASATNAAQPPSTVLSNLTTTGVSPGATNAGFYIGSSSGKGTNTSFYGMTSVGPAVFQNTIEVQGLGVGRLALFKDQNNIVQTAPNVDDVELGFLDGVTSGIQAQIDAIVSSGGSVDPTNPVLANFIGTGAYTNANTIYVSPSGVDSAVGSAVSPIKNVDTAAFRLRGVGTVIMQDGIHAQNPNWSLWTNLVIRSQNVGMMTNILGTNITAFTDIGSGVFRVTSIASSWLKDTNDGASFIWQRGSNSFDTFIAPSERKHLQPNQSYYLNDMVHLVATNTVANLQNGYYAISNLDIYFRLADGGVQNGRSIHLPALQTTNSFGYGGQLHSSITMIGIYSYFGNCGTVVTGTKYFKDYHCWFVGNYAEGAIDDTMWGVWESDNSAFLFNSNDGVGLTSNGTNLNVAKFENPLVVGNQDGGIDAHALANVYIHNGLIARQYRTDGATAFGGKAEADGVHFFLNDVGPQVGEGGVFYDSTRTNLYAQFIVKNCLMESNRLGAYITSGITNAILELHNTTWKGNGNDAFSYNNGLRQFLKVYGTFISDTPDPATCFNTPPTTWDAVWFTAASQSGVTLGNTNLVVRTLSIGINTNGILYTGAGGQVSTAALYGLTFSGGVLAATGGGGGTNFPNVNLLLGNTNLVLSSGVMKSFRQSTNANNFVNFNLAVPESGYDVTVTHTNSAATNYDVTFYTNGVAANFYSLIDKTNATSWTVPAGSVVSQHFIFFSGQWMRTDVEAPLLTVAAGVNVTLTTNGMTLTIASSGSGTGGAQVTNVSLFTGASTNLVIDLGLASTNHVVFTVGMLTNSHIVLSNALLRKFPVTIVWQQDTNGQRSITSLRSTDGLIQTNGLPITITTNANAEDIWSLSAAYFSSNVVVDVGISSANLNAAGGGTTMLQFNWAGILDGTNEFTVTRGSGASLLVSNTSPINGQVRLNGGSLIRLDSNSGGLNFGVSGLTNWSVDTSGNWKPTGSNTFDSGTFAEPAKTNYANDFVALETVFTPILKVGPTPAAITNIVTASTNLDFGSRTIGVVEDIPVFVAGVKEGDAVIVMPPTGSIGPIVGSFSGFASNSTVYVRFISTGTAQDPASGTFKVMVFKY